MKERLDAGIGEEAFSFADHVVALDEAQCHGHVRENCIFAVAAWKSAALSFLVFPWHVDPRRDVDTADSPFLPVPGPSMYTLSRWWTEIGLIRNLGRRLRVYIDRQRGRPTLAFQRFLPGCEISAAHPSFDLFVLATRTRSLLPRSPCAIRPTGLLLSLQLMPSLVRTFSQLCPGERRMHETERTKVLG